MKRTIIIGFLVVANLALAGRLVLRLTVSNHPVERETLAAQAGLLPCLRSEINRLRSEAGFFVDTEIERFILSHTRGSRAAAQANPKAIRTMAP